MRSTSEPCPGQHGLVGCVIIYDDMDIEVPSNPRVDLLEEVEKLGRTMALVAFAGDEARGDVERREQLRCAVANVAVGAALGHAGHHPQDRLLAVERLDLRLLVDAEHECAVGRRQVEPDDVADLADEQRIAQQLECLRSVRL